MGCYIFRHTRINSRHRLHSTKGEAACFLLQEVVMSIADMKLKVGGSMVAKHFEGVAASIMQQGMMYTWGLLPA